MARNMLKNYGRFELLELIYNMRKENLELKERCAEAEKQVLDIKNQTEKQLDNARRDYENRIEELRMQGAAKDLQIRMKKIEEQLRMIQRLTSVDVDLTDMPTEDEIEELAEQENQEREERNSQGKENEKAKGNKT
jgi:superfamily II RNA helicase